MLSAVTERQVNKKLFQLYVNKDRDFADRATTYEETIPIRPLDEIDLERGLAAEEAPSKKKAPSSFSSPLSPPSPSRSSPFAFTTA